MAAGCGLVADGRWIDVHCRCYAVEFDDKPGGKLTLACFLDILMNLCRCFRTGDGQAMKSLFLALILLMALGRPAFADGHCGDPLGCVEVGAG